MFSLGDGSLTREIRGSGDTFDVSWSFDGSLMSCCFSSGALHVLEASSMAATAAVGSGAALTGAGTGGATGEGATEAVGETGDEKTAVPETAS